MNVLGGLKNRWQRWSRRRIWIRRIVQVLFFALIAAIAVNHTLAESGGDIPLLSNASLHALCPFGGVVTIYQYATTGSFVQKIHESAFILMILGFLLAILFGPVFCGWVCPLGSLQEWFSGLGRKIFKRRRYNHFIPTRIDKPLRYLRYGVLAWVLYMTAMTGKLIFAEYDPYFALFNFWSSEVAVTGLLVLGAILTAGLVVERPWCKYACPYGAVLGLFNPIRVFQLHRVEATCKLDGVCNNACPMNIPVDELEVIRDHQCIACLECTSEASCPAAATVEMRLGKPRPDALGAVEGARR